MASGVPVPRLFVLPQDSGINAFAAGFTPADAAIAVDDDAFGGASGFARRRAAEPPAPAAILRYYDITRDYQPGLQRAAFMREMTAKIEEASNRLAGITPPQQSALAQTETSQ